MNTTTGVSRYSVPRWFRYQIVMILVVLGIAAVVDLRLATANPPGVPAWMAAYYLFGWVWVAYWWLFRVAMDIQFDGECIRWRSIAKSGTLSLADLREVRPMICAPSAAVLVPEHGRKIIVQRYNGFSAFSDSLKHIKPQLIVQTSKMAMLFERSRRKSGYTESLS